MIIKLERPLKGRKIVDAFIKSSSIIHSIPLKVNSHVNFGLRSVLPGNTYSEFEVEFTCPEENAADRDRILEDFQNRLRKK